MISTMGKLNGDGQGDFLCIDSETFEVKGTWTRGDKKAGFGYDFWYQPHHDVLVASEWSAPKVFKNGYTEADSSDPAIYGRSLNFYSWSERKLKQVIKSWQGWNSTSRNSIPTRSKRPSVGFVG